PSQPDQDPTRAAPHSRSGALEAVRDQLPKLTRHLRGGRDYTEQRASLCRFRRRRGALAGRPFTPARLLEREPQQLGTLLLLEEGGRDPALVARAPDAVRAVGHRLSARVRALTQDLPAEGCHRTAFGNSWRQMDAATRLSTHRLEPDHGYERSGFCGIE